MGRIRAGTAQCTRAQGGTIVARYVSAGAGGRKMSLSAAKDGTPAPAA